MIDFPTFIAALIVVLILLKMAGVVTLGWWAILAPFWGPLAVYLAWVIVSAAFEMRLTDEQRHERRSREALSRWARHLHL